MFDDIANINHSHRQMTAAEVAQEHAEWFNTYRDLYHPRTLEIILKGQQISAGELETARAGRLEIATTAQEAQTKHGIDLWISPATTGDAPKGIHATGAPRSSEPTLDIQRGSGDHRSGWPCRKIISHWVCNAVLRL